MNIEQIQFLMEFLKGPVSPVGKDLLNTINRSNIKQLLETLKVKNSRIFLYNTIGNNLSEKQLIGDAYVWEITDISKIKEDVAIFKNLHFIKIYYFNDENRKIVVGFLGVERKKILTNSELGLLQLFCRLYGDMIKQRILITIKNKTLEQLPKISEISHSNSLPGTIISKTLEYIHSGINAYTSYYYVIDDNNFYVDYVRKNHRVSVFYPKSKPLKINLNLINKISSSPRIYKVDDTGFENLYKSYKFHVENFNNNFLMYIYPAKYKNELIGCWLFIFSDKQILDPIQIRSLVEISDTLANINYKYLYQRKTKKMIVDPIFKSRDTRINDNEIFVLMPFTLDWSNRIWQKMIKPVIEKSGYNAKRADDLYGQDIMEDIWNRILTSKIIIADITSRNANVFYELGIAHTLGKNVILISQTVEDIPFDLNRYRHILYEDNFDGYEILKSRLENAIKEIEKL